MEPLREVAMPALHELTVKDYARLSWPYRSLPIGRWRHILESDELAPFDCSSVSSWNGLRRGPDWPGYPAEFSQADC